MPKMPKSTRALDVAELEVQLDAIDPDPNDAIDARSIRDIAELSVARSAIDHQLSAAVARARQAGLSWTYIANALGVSRQAARQRYGATTEDNDARPPLFLELGKHCLVGPSVPVMAETLLKDLGSWHALFLPVNGAMYEEMQERWISAHSVDADEDVKR